ncbi:MAG: hypothetical protein WC438_01180 [Candidatus Pacearchaeota archaeon]
METTKINLEVGKEYKIKLYPTDETANAAYIGNGEAKNYCSYHVFKYSNGYIFVNNQWIKQEEDVITHQPISSFSILRVPKDVMKKQPKDTGLKKLLKELGENL